MAPIVTHLMPIERVTEAFDLSESRGDGVVKGCVDVLTDSNAEVVK